MKPTIIYIYPNEKRIRINTNNKCYRKEDPYLYILQADSDNKHPFYVGETGKSENYTVVDRVRYHFQKGSSNTLNRVHKNSEGYGFVIPDKVKAYCNHCGTYF